MFINLWKTECFSMFGRSRKVKEKDLYNLLLKIEFQSIMTIEKIIRNNIKNGLTGLDQYFL